MTPSSQHSKQHALPDAPNLRRLQARLRRRSTQRFSVWRALIPLAFVMASLAALAVLPIVFEQRMRPLQDDILDAIEPSRLHVVRLTSLLANEMALLRGYLLSDDARMLERYHALRQQEVLIYGWLAPLANRIGPRAREQLGTLQRRVTMWHTAAPELTSAVSVRGSGYSEALRVSHQFFEEAIAAATALEQTLYAAEQQRRDDVRQLMRTSDLARVALLLLAGLSVLVVGWTAVRQTRRARAEAGLRRASELLSGTSTIDEIMKHAAAQAAPLAHADGAYVERVVPEAESVEVVARAGHGAPDVGTRAAFSGSLTRSAMTHSQPQRVFETRLIGDDLAPRMAQSCRGCSALVILLLPESGTPLGALVLLRRARRRRFDYGEVALACTLADLVSLNAGRLMLLAEAQARRVHIEELSTAKARLMRGISHDLKNPLGALDGYAALLESGIKGPLSPDQQQFVTRIRRAGQAMLETIEKLMEMTSTDAAQIPLRLVPTNVVEIAREAAEDYRATAHVAGLELRVDMSEALPQALTDPARVRAILGNFLSNAVKYTPAGGRVIVRAGTRSGTRAPGSGTWIIVDVEDQGHGIAPEDQEKIFEEFQRLDPHAGRGAGIGLSISRRIARLLGGDVSVRSALGEGSTFTLWLPLDGQ